MFETHIRRMPLGRKVMVEELVLETVGAYSVDRGARRTLTNFVKTLPGLDNTGLRSGGYPIFQRVELLGAAQ